MDDCVDGKIRYLFNLFICWYLSNLFKQMMRPPTLPYIITTQKLISKEARQDDSQNAYSIA